MTRTLWLVGALLVAVSVAGAPAAQTTMRGDQRLADYFRAETARLSGRCLADIHSRQDWKARRGEYRRQLFEMLGLWPLPERTPLQPVITGKLEEEDFTVEKLQFQAMPGLYVTANLYLPRKRAGLAPGILYACGHSLVVTNGVSCGNKTGYQHHGVWFARNGYVCLLIDTLQLGEIQGQHRGTYHDGQWWWNSRGYTPAGVEAWFGLRALDYLCARPEVDAQRIGMTGRSGGGAYTWTVAALDERVKVAAPVAGMTDLQNQVVDGAVDGHCDCMFFINTYRWDFPQVAALIAPRPLLIGNSDRDTLFPLDGVVRLYFQARRIYQLYGATNKLGLLITDGPHADTQALQLPVFRWFNHYLNGEDPVIEMAAKKLFAPQQLRVFDRLPADEVNTKIQDTFVPAARAATTPEDWLPALREKVFAGWPDEPCARQEARADKLGTAPLDTRHSPLAPRPSPLDTRVRPELGATAKANGLRLRAYAIDTQPNVRLCLYVVQETGLRKPDAIALTILDAASWANSPACGLWLGGLTTGAADDLRREMRAEKTALAFFAPRLVEPSAGLSDAKKATQVRRRFMLLGQTLDGMRVWDIRCAVQGLRALPEFKRTRIQLRAQGEMGVNAAYAALFEPAIARLDLEQLPRSHRQGPDYLNVMKYVDIPQVLERLGERVHAQ